MMPSISVLPRRTLEEMAAAGREIRECIRVLDKTGDDVIREAVRPHAEALPFAHYPYGDVYDGDYHAQFYYHTHRDGEAGHFHTFLRPLGMPRGVRPAGIPNAPPPRGPNDAVCHLVAISVDRAGRPFRLFTTNRWVTGEVWYHAAEVRRMLPCFRIDHAQPSWPLNRWITAMLVLFRPQIEILLTERDACIAERRAACPDEDVFDDRELEVTSSMEISVEAQIEAVEAAFGHAAPE